MGRTILCPHCKSTFDEDILKQRDSMDVCLVCGESLLGNGDAAKAGGEEHPDWITWYYYGFKSDNGKSGILKDEPIDLNEHGDVFFLVKEFKAPPRDESGSSKRAREILRTYIPDAFEEPKEEPKVRCPYCFSSEVQIVPKKYSLLTGFATNGYNRVCVKCKRKF